MKVIIYILIIVNIVLNPITCFAHSESPYSATSLAPKTLFIVTPSKINTKTNNIFEIFKGFITLIVKNKLLLPIISLAISIFLVVHNSIPSIYPYVVHIGHGSYTINYKGATIEGNIARDTAYISV